MSCTSGGGSSVSTTGASSTIAASTSTDASTTAPPTSTNAPTTTGPAPTTAVTTTVVIKPCAAIDFRNFTFDLPDFGAITVVSGQGVRGTPASADYAALQVRGTAIGDIGGVDAAAETAVHTNVNTGGTGQFTDVHVYRCTSGVATRIVSAGAGDRAFDGVRSVAIANGKLVIDRYTDAEGACCPTAAERQAFVLTGSTLVASGSPAKRRFIGLDTGAPAVEAPIAFLPGTSGAIISGGTGTASAGGFDASGGQTLRLVVEPASPGLTAAVIDIRQGTTVLAIATSTPVSLVLPATGHYTLVARPATGTTSVPFDAEMTIS